MPSQRCSATIRNWMAQLPALLGLALFLTAAPAVSQSRDPVALIDRALALQSAGRITDAIPIAEAAVSESTNRLGAAHPTTAEALNTLAMLYARVDRFPEAEAAMKRSLAIYERATGPTARNTPLVLNNLGAIYKDQGRFAEAIAAFERGIALNERLLGAGHLALAAPLNNLGDAYRALGRYSEAERLFQRSLGIREKAQGREHVEVAESLNNLAVLYLSQGRLADAEPLFRRSLSIKEKTFGRQHLSVASTLNNLGLMFIEQRRFDEAEPLLRRALDINAATLGPTHATVAVGSLNLAKLYQDQGQRERAEALYRQSLAIYMAASGNDNPAIPNVLNNLAALAYESGRYGEAEGLIDRSRAMLETALGSGHPAVAASLRNLAQSHMAQKKWQTAYDTLTRATSIYRSRQGVSNPFEQDALQSNSAGRLAYSDLATAAWTLSLEQPSRRLELANAAFEAGQLADQQVAAAALGQMSIRFGAGNTRLAKLVRERQDTGRRWQNANEALNRALSAPSGQRHAATLADLRRDIASLEATVASLGREIEVEFPAFTELSTPRPLTIEQVQKLIGPEEILLAYLVGSDASFVWAVTREASLWQRLPVDGRSLASQIVTLRSGLELQDLKVAQAAGKLFDLDISHALHRSLLEPIQGLLRTKPSIIVVPSGPLTSLPFQLLVTAKPPAAWAGDLGFSSYRQAQWLIRSHAVSVLPAVSSLKALRGLPRAVAAPQPMIGFADPVFDSAPSQVAARGALAPTDLHRTRAPKVSQVWRGSAPDIEALRSSLARLPETADELRAVAKALGAGEGDLRLGAFASETNVKSSDLANYRIVYFATHALVSGELTGVAEPALALSLPPRPSPLDDGLLTASEVAQLKLNADWVILSACNTAAGDIPGAEALSGLARAFFYAGARALMVSHWKVFSEAAVRLTTSSFEALQKDPAIGRAEALRRAMLTVIDNPTNSSDAYPDFWGPFSVVGEGGPLNLP